MAQLTEKIAYQERSVSQYTKELSSAKAQLVSTQEVGQQQYRRLQTIIRAIEESDCSTTNTIQLILERGYKKTYNKLSFIRDLIIHEQEQIKRLKASEDALADLRYHISEIEAKHTFSLHELERDRQQPELKNRILQSYLDQLKGKKKRSMLSLSLSHQR